MKKLFFSAVALVAFSSVSMGNTTAVEQKESVVKVEKANPCRSTFEYYFNQALTAGYDADSAWTWASFNYDLCTRGLSWAIVAP
ncbi:hypothetical protein WFZ85_06520 [Flavobacterium sp. j3]|uniref:Uncharacterized protein n=1 Tax=Flavobacterium aureirubrum TaxID=3133147 RepID=A0ABU9N415_9FLAO|nr:hypothetical protein [Flavobacterium sp.]